MARRRKRKSRGLGVIRYLMTVAACVVLVVGAVCLYGIQLQNRQTDRVNQELRSQFHSAEATAAAIAAAPEATEAPAAAENTSPAATEAPAAASETLAAAAEQAESFASAFGQAGNAATEAPVAAAEAPETATGAPVVAEASSPTEAPAAETSTPEEAPVQVAEADTRTSGDDTSDDSGILPVALAEGAEPEVTPEPVLQEAFVELYEQNPDLIGWLKVCDHIEEPVLYRDNSFYMDHDFYGQSSNAGAIFLDVANVPEMSDDSLLLYGHNMKNGAMFGDLDFFREKSYLAKYPIISLQSAWEAEPRQYAIFSLFDASMNKTDPSYIRIRQFNFETDEEKLAYIQELQSRSIIDVPLEVGAEDQLVMLVTCSYSHDNGRFLMVARQLRDGETAEDIAALYN